MCFWFARVVSTPTAMDLSEPDDLELQVMQARFMEIQLVKLKVYECMALIGCVCFV